MAAFPTCIRCLGTESELDLVGVCTTCHSKASGRESASHAKKSTIPPASQTLAEDATRTAPPFALDAKDSSTITLQRQAIHPPPNLPANVRFTNYQDLQFLDRGGMGLVYKATQTNANRVVALKMMNLISQSDSRQERRFKTEAEALARLSHPGIVQIYDVGHENGVSFFSMEYVSGGTLAKRLKNGPKLPHREAAELMAGVASALAAAHAVGVIHRDIKPSNILLSEVGRPKLTDFGLAALSDHSARFTNTGAMIGTPAYMSPEQAAGKFKDVGPRADVYSLGATLYELLAGKPPFAGETAVATAMKVIKDRVVRPREIDGTIPTELESICLKCLEKDPQDRYSSAAGMANDLTRFLRGEPIGKATVGFRVKRFVRRHRIGIAASVLLVFAGVVAIATRPEDPAKVIERKLIRGETVELVGAKGLPRYSRWVVGDSKLAVRDQGAGDGAVWFQTNTVSLLELCADTMTDRFTVEAEIQHCDASSVLASVGLYLLSHDGTQVRRWIATEFSDHPVTPINVPEEQRLIHFKITDRLTQFFPGITHEPSYFDKRTISAGFPHSVAVPRPWSRVVFSVSPLEFRAVLLNDQLDKAGLAAHESQYSQLLTPLATEHWKQTIERKVQLRGTPIPSVPLRGAVGIFAQNSEVAFRNFKITPNP